MRFVRFLCNVGIFILTFIMVFSVCILSYDVVSWGSRNDDAIHVASNDKVCFYDVIAFQFSDIGVNLSTAPKPYIRNLFHGNGRWADTAINFVAGIFKPLIVPHAQIDNLAEYRDRSLYIDLTDAEKADALYLCKSYIDERDPTKDALNHYGALIELLSFTITDHNLGGSYETADAAMAKYIGVKSVSRIDESGKFVSITVTDYNDKIIIATITDNKAFIVEENKDGEKKDIGTYVMWEEANNLDWSLENARELFGKNYENWAIAGNDLLGNRMWQSYKYNDVRYDRYAQRFLEMNKDGEYRMKTEVVMLCVSEWIALVVAAIFTIKYPITVIQARVMERRNRKNAKSTDVGITI